MPKRSQFFLDTKQRMALLAVVLVERLPYRVGPSSQRPCHGYCGPWLDEARPLIGHMSLSAAAAAALTRLPMPWSYIAGTTGRAIDDARAWGPAHV